MKTWFDTYEGQWGDKFVGVYFGDELGGKMLDGEVEFEDQETQSSLMKLADMSISGYNVDDTQRISMRYWQDGKIILAIYGDKTTRVFYYPNGTITAEIFDKSNATTYPWKIIEN